MGKVIFHIDLNAYFASAEILRNSALEGQAVVVGGLSKRSVVCTASYEARAYGVRSAMPLYEALKLCPDLIIVEGDMAYYKRISKQFFNFIRTYSPFLEIASIDECYVDMSEVIKHYKRPLDLAWEIQQNLKYKLNLKCSIGIAPNRFLAKMASDRYKPMGIFVLRKQEIQTKLWPLDIKEMFGIGKKTAPILIAQGITTIGELANPDNEAKARTILGKKAYVAIEHARGNGSDEIHFSHTIQSMSQSTTINHDVEDYGEICQILKKLSISLANRAKKAEVSGRLISISIRYHTFRTIVRSISLHQFVNDSEVLYEQALSMFDEHGEEIPIRHLGISLGTLNSDKNRIDQLSLFQKAPKQADIVDTLNNEIVGENKLMYASALLKEKDS
ncbi:MAG: DNA polymerase IV [Breznakia sp.]